jgi:hypothetical protein
LDRTSWQPEYVAEKLLHLMTVVKQTELGGRGQEQDIAPKDTPPTKDLFPSDRFNLLQFPTPPKIAPSCED